MQKSRKDVLNFDTEFTKEEPTLTPINLEVVKTINQDEFKGFSFYNTQFGKQVSYVSFIQQESEGPVDLWRQRQIDG